MTVRFGKAYYLQEKTVTSLCNDVLLAAGDGSVEKRESFKISSQWKDENDEPQKRDHPLKLRQEALDKVLAYAGKTEMYKTAKPTKESIAYFDFLNGSIEELAF
jgi:hypothetical protein